MYLTNKTIITFIPIKEDHLIKKFMEDNDMTKWTEHTSTVGITFVKEDRYCIGVRGEEDEL